MKTAFIIIFTLFVSGFIGILIDAFFNHLQWKARLKYEEKYGLRK
jgi:hypothetical protein